MVSPRKHLIPTMSLSTAQSESLLISEPQVSQDEVDFSSTFRSMVDNGLVCEDLVKMGTVPAMDRVGAVVKLFLNYLEESIPSNSASGQRALDDTRRFSSIMSSSKHSDHLHLPPMDNVNHQDPSFKGIHHPTRDTARDPEAAEKALDTASDSEVVKVRTCGMSGTTFSTISLPALTCTYIPVEHIMIDCRRTLQCSFPLQYYEYPPKLFIPLKCSVVVAASESPYK